MKALKNLLSGIECSMEFDHQIWNYPDINKCHVAIIGLGYVGLPLAVEIAKKQKSYLTGKILQRKVIGFDVNKQRVEELKNGFDRTNEIESNLLLKNTSLKFSLDIHEIIGADVFIITVPTPIDKHKNPDLQALKDASIKVGEALKIKKEKDLNPHKYIVPIVLYESTVYPGTTEEICIPIIEKISGLICDNTNSQISFSCGYSPERINPGDKNHKIKDIIKVTSGTNKKVATWIDNFYGSIIEAGTHKAKNIKVAEAAKIIENTQRDINIALINELAIIFKLLKIDTLDVLEAASTKWNFLPFKPGLVGGHCIGVDPYYLTFKAQSLGYLPEVVLSGRRINDGMPKWVADQLILEMCIRKISIKSASLLILGFTFKENCPDIRNTKVYEIYKTLKKYHLKIDIVDPWVVKDSVSENYNIQVSNKIEKYKKYSAVICAVSHHQFHDMKVCDWSSLLEENGILFDLKGLIPRELNPLRI